MDLFGNTGYILTLPEEDIYIVLNFITNNLNRILKFMFIVKNVC